MSLFRVQVNGMMCSLQRNSTDSATTRTLLAEEGML